MTRAQSGPAGFTIIEMMIAVVVLTVVAMSVGRVTQQAAEISRRARLELGASALLTTEATRLRRIPWGSLANGSRTRGDSVATWTVTDSADIRKVLLVTGYTPRSTETFVVLDSVLIVRWRSP